MLRRYCVILMFAIAGGLGSGVAAQAQSTAATPPFRIEQSPESGRSAAEVRERMRNLESRLAPAAADPGTDLVLDQARLAVDDKGATLFTMAGSVNKGTGGWFVWIVDSKKKSYRLIRMNGTPDDARRIALHLTAIGVPADLAEIQDRLTRSRANREKQRSEAVSHERVDQNSGPRQFVDARDHANGPDTRGEAEPDFIRSASGTCSGSLEGHVETWELASLIAGPFPLTRSYAYNQWSGWWDEGGWGWYAARGGSCWAEPLSFAYTTWYWDTCSFHYPGLSFGYSDVLVTGTYHNWDFGLDNVPTNVFSGIGLTGSNGMTSYNSFHYADGEGVFQEEWGWALIWGDVWISPFSYNSCP